MHILNVEMKDCAYSPEPRQFRATLVMESGTQRMSLRAAATYEEGMRRDALAEVLLQDALRQLNRMPEYRNTIGQITVARDALRTESPRTLAA